ncbi:hypothetical protein AAEX37_02015 [Oligella sp. MSHR50489EDL]|uniref:CRISPR system precrRNA processing endoribonuclease RAMP protein Cas6 n=1 Tax=Oligella sp. MSHR50489EDL TaxID=3139409 RepID=UPI003D813F1E
MELNLCRYRFSFRVLEPMRFTDYTGSTLRGVFGHTLMDLSGISADKTLQSNYESFKNSVYVKVFEPCNDGDNSSRLNGNPIPYVLEASVQGKSNYAKGDIYYFDMVLMNDATSYLAEVVLAWRRALLNGFGPKRSLARAELILVQQHQIDGSLKDLYSEHKPTLIPHRTMMQVPRFEGAQDVELVFYTPLRLQHDGRVLKTEELNAAILLRNVLRRFSLCFPEHKPQDINELTDTAASVEDHKDLYAQDWKRYSNRQKQAMRLTGSVGRWVLKQVPEAWLPYVWVGQYLHVGKNTSFGLGAYRMID